MPNNIKSLISQIENVAKGWNEKTTSPAKYKGMDILRLKLMLQQCISCIQSEFKENEESPLVADIEAYLNGVVQHVTAYTNQSYFNACVDNTFNIYKILHSFGYLNNRIDKIIKSSLPNRKIAESSYKEIIKNHNEIKVIKERIEIQKEEIHNLYNACFGEDDESYSNKFNEIEEAVSKIIDDDGYLDQIENANNKVNEYRDEILVYKSELLDGDSENESIRQQIHELNQEMLSHQKKMQQFIAEYISGSSTVVKDKDGKEVTKTVRSKKDLIDDLHKNFQLHIENETLNIDNYIKAFDTYKAAKESEIESLLKSATNASLASAFGNLRSDIDKLKKRSELYFFLSLLALISAIFIPYIPCINEWMFANEDPYIAFIKKILFTGPFIWLAYHQSRKTNQYFRLEQEYAHKEVVSRSFEGYKSQVLELYKDNLESHQMLEKLLSESISTISKNPAEVLDSVKSTNHPINDLKENLSDVVNPITKLIDSIKK